MDIDFKIFYENYSYDYHAYKTGTLATILRNSEDFRDRFLDKHFTDFNDSDYERFLKSEIRMTCFHAIETLFELIFALEPSAQLNSDLHLYQQLCESDWRRNSSRITQIAEDFNNLAFLEDPYPNRKNYSLLDHIFYFHHVIVEQSDQYLQLIEARNAITYFLHQAAVIFSNRAEYNAYKHGNRAMNAFTDFGISDSDGGNANTFDLKNSVSFVAIEKGANKKKSKVVHTKVFNTDRDILVTELCSSLISNIILRRKFYFLPEHRKNDVVTSFPTLTKVKDVLHKYGKQKGLAIEGIKTSFSLE